MLITSTTVVNFGTVQSGQTIVLTHMSALLVDSTKDNVLLYNGALATERTMVEGDPIDIPIGDIDFEVLAGVLVDAGLVAIGAAGIASYDGGFTLRLGTGAMGNNGTANQPASNTGYSEQTGVVLTVQAS